MLCQTITHTPPQLLQALWERAAQAFDIIGLVDTSSCVGKCSLQLLLHVIRAAPLRRMFLQVVAAPGHCCLPDQLTIIQKGLQASSQALHGQP